MADGRQALQGIAERIGLEYDKKQVTAHGRYQDFTMVIRPEGKEKQQSLCVSLCAAYPDGRVLESGILQQLSLPEKCHVMPAGYRIFLQIELKGGLQAVIDRAKEALGMVVGELSARGAVNCDEKGIVGLSSVYRLQGNYVILSEETAENLRYQLSREQAVRAQKKENYLLGIVGALLGSLVGAAVVFLIARLGYISVLGGAVLGGAIVYGYKKLAGKYSVTGFLISLVFSTVMSFLAFYTDAAVGLYMEAKDYFTFWDIFANVRPIYEAMGALRHYYVNLALMMLVGIASTAALGSSSLKEQKEEGELERL